MGVTGGFWLIFATSVGVFVLAAKTHGRQIRLERELHGYMDATFGRENPPFVEALWKRDRIRFWVNVARFSPFFVFGFSVWAANGLRLPGTQGAPGLLDLVAVLLVAVVLWTPIVAFLLNAETSYARFMKGLAEPDPDHAPLRRGDAVRRDRPRWLYEAVRGTWAWGLVAAFGVSAIIGMVAGGL
ncbi:MAG: hypothetical protein HYT80_11235 [Euryarchaeota archaeon]|nr:hypothetical protein [Euryarchaeota archaeon]